MILRGSSGGTLRRAISLALALCAVAAAYRFAVLLVAGIGDPTTGEPGSLIDRWHVWLGIALACAAAASLSWGHRPRKRE